MTKRFFLLCSIISFGWFVCSADLCYADVEALLKDATDHAKAGELAEAEAIYVSIISDQPESDEAFISWRELIMLRVSQDRLVDTEIALSGMLTGCSSHDRLPHAIHEIAELSAATKKTDQITTVFESLLSKSPSGDQAIWLHMGMAILGVLSGEDHVVDTAVQAIVETFGTDERIAEAIGQVAWAYRKAKKEEQALHLYQSVVTHWSGYNRAVFSQRGIVLCQIALGNRNAAWTAVESLLSGFSASPHKSEVMFTLAEEYQNLKDYGKARQLCQFLVDNYPSGPYALPAQKTIIALSIRLGDGSGTTKAVDGLLSTFGQNKDIAQAALAVADQCRRQFKRYDESRRLYEYILANRPDDPDAMWAARGLACLDVLAGRYDAAEERITGLLTAHPEHQELPQALVWSANDFLRAGQYDKAVSCYEHVVLQWPESEHAIQSQVSIIIARVESKDFAGATTAIDGLFAKFSERDDIAKIATELGDQCRREYGRGQQARYLYNGVVQRWPESEHAMWAQRGIVFLDIEDGDYAAAEASIEKLVSRYPDHEGMAKAFRWLGNDYARKGVVDKATWCYQHVVNRWPQTGEAVASQKELILQDITRGDYTTAQHNIGILTERFAGQKGLGEALFQVAKAYKKQGKVDEAVTLYITLAKNLPKSSFARQSLIELGQIGTDLGEQPSVAIAVDVDMLIAEFGGHPFLAKSLQRIGREHEYARDYVQAKSVHEKILQHCPDAPEAKEAQLDVRRSDISILIMTGQCTEAGVAVDQFVNDFQGDPKLSYALWRIGEEYYYEGLDYGSDSSPDSQARANEALQSALKMWERVGNMPDADYTSSMRSYYFSGMCLRQLGRFEDALRIFERVAEQFAPGEFTDDAYYLWAACCCHLAQYGEAREASQRLIERYPKTQLSARAQANITRIALSTLSRVERDEAISFFDAQHDAWLGIRSGSARYSVEMRLRRGDLCAAEHMGTGTFEFSVSLIDGPDLKQHPVKIRVRWYDEANKRHYLSDNIFDSEGAFSCWRDGSYRPESKASQVQNGFMGLTRLLFTPVDLMAGTYTTSVWDDHLLMSKNDFFAYRGTPIRRDKPTGMGQATGSCYLFMPHSRPSEAHYWLDGVNGELRQIDVLKYRGIVRQLRYDDYFKNQIGGPIFPRRFTCCFKEGDGLKADGWEYTLELSDVSLNADIPAERFTRPGG